METKDERYATFREHAELRERTASLEATMLQVGPTLARIETIVAAKNTSPPAPVDHGALAMQRALDVLERTQGRGGGAPAWLLALAFIGAIAIGAMGMRFFTGG